MTNVKPTKHVYHFGLDHLEIYATFLHENIFTGTDYENSNQGFFGDLSFIKTENPRYAYQVVFSKNNIALFSYFKGRRLGRSIKTDDYVAVYSSCFRIYGVEQVINVISSYFKSKEKRNLRRFDICFDFNIPIDVIISKFKKAEQRGSDFYGSIGEIQTRYIGEKKYSKNKRSLIRIYNKKDDILSKGKNVLYEDYLLEDFMTRIELEVRRELAQNYTFEELLIGENLIGIMKNYLGNHTSLFEEFETSKISLYRKPKKVDYGKIQAYGEGLMHVRIFLGHARGLLKRGLDPVYALLSKDIIHPTTYKILEESGNFIQIMREIKDKEQNWKDIMNAIKDKFHDPD